MCAIEYAEPWDVYRHTDRIARKRHTCDDCFRIIQPNERYYYGVGLADGNWHTIKQCSHCQAAGSWLVEMCGGYLFGGLLEELEEHWTEGYRSWPLGRTIVHMRRRWRDGADPVPIGLRKDVQRLLHTGGPDHG